MATADDYAAWIVKNADKRGTPEFDTVAQAYQMAKSETKPKPQVSDPTEDMSFFDTAAAGLGKAAVDTFYRLPRQAIGLASQQEIDEAKRLDEPLMRTAGGVTGNIAGNIGMMVGPAAAVGAIGKAAQLPRLVNAARALMAPKTIPGAAASGATMGALQPVASDESLGTNMLLGGIGGAALPLVVGAGGLAKTLVSPFSAGGRDKLAGATIERFASDPNKLASASTRGLVPGSTPTLAEVVDDVGLSQLQRTLQNNPDSAGPLAERLRANNNARVNALQDIAGDEGKRQFYTGMRDEAAKDNYAMAFAQQMHDTPWIKGQITQLSKRPSFQKAMDKAGDLAAEQGIKLDPENAAQVAHFAKLALDDQISAAVRAGNNVEAKAILGTREKLLSLMESDRFSPAYREARKTYAEMSRPINQMEIGQQLVDTLRPALGQFGADTRVNAASYAKAVRDADATAKKATGFSGARLENIMEPDQLATINNVAKELGNTARAQELGMAKGSPTAQNLISQDILRQTLGPLGLPQSWAEAVLPQTLMRPMQCAYKMPEQKVMGLLGEAMLDPDKAKQLLAKARRSPALARQLEELLPYTAAPGAVGLLGLSQ
jgi:hypothetical protein